VSVPKLGCLCQPIQMACFTLLSHCSTLLHPEWYSWKYPVELFRRYCMGHEPIQLRILPSTTSSGASPPLKSPFVRGFGNYEDEFYSVDLPVFAIHGNHDDPSRDGGNSDLYAALDLLDVANLVNYFGKQEDSKAISIDPILLKKGGTHLALYGLGSMRDERLNRMWRGEQVSFSRPDKRTIPEQNNNNIDDENDDETCPNFFNIFALHQNRDYGRGTKNCIKEDMIPEWMVSSFLFTSCCHRTAVRFWCVIYHRLSLLWARYLSHSLISFPLDGV
jgi:DNA repair exonuclease SbcCD nuclease subunit